MCSSKKTYTTRSAAAEALALLQYRKATGTIQDMCWAKRAYFCDMHQGWHLTKQDLKRRPNNTDVLPGDY